jgi:thiol-disulfide isomerase/thioredoxin
MSKHLFLLILISISSLLSADAQSINDGHFTLTGKVAGRDTGKLILNYLNKFGKHNQDTAWLQHGEFSFKGYVDGASYARLTGDIKTSYASDPNLGDMFLEPGNISLALTENNFKYPVVGGSPIQCSYDSIKSNLQLIEQRYKPVLKEFSRLKSAVTSNAKASADSMAIIQPKVGEYQAKRMDVYLSYIRNHPASYLSAGLLANFVFIKNIGVDSAQKYYDGLSPKIRNSAMGMEFYENLNGQRRLLKATLAGGIGAVGSIAQDFSTPEIGGKMLSLSSFRNKKYVLLDFWATWCPPCIAMMPTLKQFYTKYHDKGLEVISVSWDNNQHAWKAGVNKESINLWYNIYAGPNKDAELIRKYEILALPTTLLIDKNGIIIGRYTSLSTSIDGLTKQLEELLK